MKWKEILDFGLSSTGAGGSPDQRAVQMRFPLLSEANRRMHAKLDVAECFKRSTISVTPNQDWVPTPPDLYSISWMQNRTGGSKLRKEPNGSLGRSQFFVAATDKPATGEIESVQFYWRDGDKIWLRDTPNEAGVLEIEYKFIPDDLDENDLQKEPVLPSQYHFMIAQVFAGIYYTLHPPRDPATDSPMVAYGPNRIQTVWAEIDGPMGDPRAEEDLDTQRVVWQPGYEMGGLR